MVVWILGFMYVHQFPISSDDYGFFMLTAHLFFARFGLTRCLFSCVARCVEQHGVGDRVSTILQGSYFRVIRFHRCRTCQGHFCQRHQVGFWHWLHMSLMLFWHVEKLLFGTVACHMTPITCHVGDHEYNPERRTLQELLPNMRMNRICKHKRMNLHTSIFLEVPQATWAPFFVRMGAPHRL